MPEGEIWEFYRIMSAALAGTMLGGWFFASLLAYTRHEKNGTEKTGNATWLIAQMLFVCLIMISGLYSWGFFG